MMMATTAAAATTATATTAATTTTGIVTTSTVPTPPRDPPPAAEADAGADADAYFCWQRLFFDLQCSLVSMHARCSSSPRGVLNVPCTMPHHWLL